MRHGRAFRAHDACTCTSVQGLCLHAMPCGRHIQSPCACSPACLLVRIPFGGVCVRQVCTAHLQGTPMSRTCVHCHRASRCAAARRARSRAPGTGPPMCGSGSQFRDFFFFCVGARDPHATAPAGGAPASGCLPQAPASGCLPPTRWPHTVTRSLCSHDMPLQLCETTLAVICQDGSLWTIGDCTPPIKHLHAVCGMKSAVRAVGA
jgi:hypothetical protein